jgi:hypothetical protein
MIVQPLYTGILAGKPIRFFRTPFDDRRPDFPWHAMNDLLVALAVPTALHTSFLCQMHSDSTKVYRTVATSIGLVNVASHCATQGLVSAIVAVGCAPASVEHEYTVAATQAGMVLTERLSDKQAAVRAPIRSTVRALASATGESRPC